MKILKIHIKKNIILSLSSNKDNPFKKIKFFKK